VDTDTANQPNVKQNGVAEHDAVFFSTPMWAWMVQNKTWLFSGVGVTVLVGLYFAVRSALTTKTATSSASSVAPPSVPAVQNKQFVNVTPEYLVSLFDSEHTSTESQKLAEVFVNKWLRVSGHLGEVKGGTPYLMRVTFAEPARHCVLLDFKSQEGFDRLATLKREDAITVIGKITEIDKYSVCLDNCEISDS
jgi:hypothetical protein